MWPGCIHPGENQIVLAEPQKRYSLQVLSPPGLEIACTLDPPGPISGRLSEYRALTITAGLSARGVFHGLGLYANLLGQGLGKQERVQVARGRTPRLSLLPTVVSPTARRDIPRS